MQKKCGTFLLGLILLIQVPGFTQLKKRVAVFTFEDKTRGDLGWWGGKRPGDGMADMLTTALVQSGKYVVIERSEISQILDEIKMGQTGAVTAQSAVQAGKLLGVEVAIMGAITEFGHSQSGQAGEIGGFKLGVGDQKAVVAVDIRMVNTTTGEILIAETVRKEKKSSGIQIQTPEAKYENEKSFDNSLVGKATRLAIKKIVKLINAQSESLPWEGKIILIKGSDIYIQPGSDAGVKNGDIFQIYSKGEELIDPDTGLSLGSVDQKIGSIEIISILPSGKAAKAAVRTGSGFQKGDLVRLN